MTRRFASALVFAVVCAACSTPPEPLGPRIDSADDLVGALRDAGVEVQETAMPALRAGLPGGRVVLVGAERVEIYELPTEDERQRRLADLPLETWPTGAPNVWSRSRIIVVYDGVDGPTVALLSGLLGDSLTLVHPDTVEPYPPAVAAAIGHLVEWIGVDPGAVEVVAYESAEWPDACLGLAQPEEACAQVVTPGWLITLQVDSRTYHLRTDELGGVARVAP